MSTVISNNKEIVTDLLRRLPDEVSLHQIADEIEFVAAVREGLAELDNGEEIPIEILKEELLTWSIR